MKDIVTRPSCAMFTHIIGVPCSKERDGLHVVNARLWSEILRTVKRSYEPHIEMNISIL